MIRDLIKLHEGLRLSPYPCSKGKTTIGYGWNIDANPLPEEIASHLRYNGYITYAMAESLLDISLESATRQAWGIFLHFGGFSEARQAALVDMIFNLGAAGVLKFKRMLAAIKAGDWDKAADEAWDSDWRKQVGGRAETICGMLRAG